MTVDRDDAIAIRIGVLLLPPRLRIDFAIKSLIILDKHFRMTIFVFTKCKYNEKSGIYLIIIEMRQKYKNKNSEKYGSGVNKCGKMATLGNVQCFKIQFNCLAIQSIFMRQFLNKIK